MSANWFTYDEIACNCSRNCGFDVVAGETLSAANAVRNFLGYAVWGSSTCRCVMYNQEIDPAGAQFSTHLPWKCGNPVTISDGEIIELNPQMASLGMDLNFRRADVPKVIRFLKERFPKLSVGGYHWGVHIDSGVQHNHPRRLGRQLWGTAA